MGLNFHGAGQAELILQCYLSPNSFVKATAAPVSLVYPRVIRAGTSNGWEVKQFVPERHQNKTNPSRFQMEQTFKVTFPLFCLWVAWFSFKQSSCVFFFTPELNNSVFTVEFLSFPKQKTKFIPVPYKSEEELSEEGFPIGEFAKINSSCLFLYFVAWGFSTFWDLLPHFNLLQQFPTFRSSLFKNKFNKCDQFN